MVKVWVIFVMTFVLFAEGAIAQQSEPVVVSTKKHKIVIQLASGDTIVHKNLLRQLDNMQTAAPNAKIEVVCHNDGIGLLQTKVSPQAGRIDSYSKKGVDFVACENTMRQRKIAREDLVNSCRLVPAGILEIVMKQEKKWAYIKAGN